MLTGRRPYQLTTRTPAGIAEVICNAVPERPSTAVTRTGDAVTAPGAVTAAAGALEAGVTSGRPSWFDPQRLRRRLAGDLDNIVLKALSKDPGRRYVSVDQFSDDVRRHLEGLPVIARKDTVRYRVGKFVRRNRTGVAAASLVLVALVAGIIGTSWQARAAGRERARAERRFEDVRRLANASLLEIHDAIRDLPGPHRPAGAGSRSEYLDKLGRIRRSTDLQRELSARMSVGDVRPSVEPTLGDTAVPLASYRTAVATYERSCGASADPALRRSWRWTAPDRCSRHRPPERLSPRPPHLQCSSVHGGGRRQAARSDLGRGAAASYTALRLLSATGTHRALEPRRRACRHETVAAIAPDDSLPSASSAWRILSSETSWGIPLPDSAICGRAHPLDDLRRF